MSRKRDTNWTRDEITVLLDSIMEMTQMRADGGRRTNSREVFEYAARKLGEKGHTSRAEREKCRTKWKKMKEEFTHAKRARETGQGRVAPGIEPFYSRMFEFINGNFDNISPHSTIVRRSSSISSNNTSTNTGSSNNGHSSSATTNGTTENGGAVEMDDKGGNANGSAISTTPTNTNRISHAASRASARLAASSNGTGDTSDTNANAVATRQTSATDFSQNVSASSDARPAAARQQQSTRLPSPIPSAGPDNNSININNGNHVSDNKTYPAITANGVSGQNNHDRPRQQPAASRTGTYDDSSYSCHIHDNSSSLNNTTNNTSSHNTSNDFTNHLQPAERDADISYRVSTGCRQIIIFGDHDVDIKFRGDCVTINKISTEFPTSSVCPGNANSSEM